MKQYGMFTIRIDFTADEKSAKKLYDILEPNIVQKALKKNLNIKSLKINFFDPDAENIKSYYKVL